MSDAKNVIAREAVRALPWRQACVVGALVPTGLVVFRPFGLSIDNTSEAIVVASLAPINVFLALALHLLRLPSAFQTATFGAVTASLLNAAYLSLASQSGWGLWIQAPILGITVVGIVELWLRQARARDVIAAMREKIELKDRVVVIESEDQRDRLSIGYSDLVAVKAEGNYCRIFWLSAGVRREAFLRVSLRSLSEQASNVLTPTHRSWLVNVAKIEHLHGGTKDLQLRMQGGLEVPVSRARATSVHEALDTLGE